MKQLPLMLARVVTGNNLQHEARRDTRLVGYLTSKMSACASKMLALKGQVHKDQGNRSLSFVPWSSTQAPNLNNTTRARRERLFIQHPFFLRG